MGLRDLEQQHNPRDSLRILLNVENLSNDIQPFEIVNCVLASEILGLTCRFYKRISCVQLFLWIKNQVGVITGSKVSKCVTKLRELAQKEGINLASDPRKGHNALMRYKRIGERWYAAINIFGYASLLIPDSDLGFKMK
jgi:hypothetical protein